MTDSERKRTPTTPGRASPRVAFDRAMAAVDARCLHLATLLHQRDLDGVESVARSAVNVWLAGGAAYRRLAARDPASPDTETARARLDAMYLQLRGLLNRASAQLARHATRDTVDDLRRQLVAAVAVLDSDATITPKALSGDD